MRALWPLLAVASVATTCTHAPSTSSPPSAPVAARPPAPPGVVAGHPRIWITAADLPRLRSWATPANAVWQQGIVPATQRALKIYDEEFFPGGNPNPRWPDPGTTNWVPRATEAYAEFFAFLSLVDPDPATRAAHAARAKRLLMEAVHRADEGQREGTMGPFAEPAFATYNRASAWGEGFGLTVDWIYPSLDAEDKAAIHRVFLHWADAVAHAATSGQEHPTPVGVLDDPRLLADRKRLRWAANNYFTAHMRQLVTYGLALDPADDPPLDRHAPVTSFGNTLRSYLDDAIGAWLYEQYAVYEEPVIAGLALGVPPEGLGVASGGLPAEGFLYGASLGMLNEALLALYTAGYRDPKVWGPQIRLIDSHYWDRVADGVLHSIVPRPEEVPAERYLGPVYQMASYGDTQRFWLTPDVANGFLSMTIHAEAVGNEAQAQRARWIAMEAVQGTSTGLYHRIADIWGNSEASRAILHFLALDPKEAPPPDPRPKLPLAFFDRPLGRLVARTAWGPIATVFDYKCSWNTIDHQLGDCNQFELWRKGEWLVKERAAYPNDLVVKTSEFHNTLALQNRPASGALAPRGLEWFERVSWDRGGQQTLGMNAGDPHVVTSTGPGFAYAQGDATPLYNRPARAPAEVADEVEHASRSIAWLKPDVVIVYDRATTRDAELFKRFHLVTGGDPEVKGKLATFTTPKHQRLYVRTLLPEGAVLTAARLEPVNQLAAGEPSRSRLTVEDPSHPRDVRFLHVLEGADPGAAPSPATLVRCEGATPFEGAVVGHAGALFAVNLAAPFTRVACRLPSTTTALLVGGLRPGGAYDVLVDREGESLAITVQPGATTRADEAGVLAWGSLAGR